jgi:hypothetical protein
MPWIFGTCFDEVRMRKLVICATSAVVLLLASVAHAQPQPFEGRLLVSVNGGGQFGGSDVDLQTSYPIYGETAQIQIHQDLGGGGLFDFGAAYRVGTQWGVGFAFNRSGDRTDGDVSGTIPHQVFTNRPRSFATTANDLEHNESAFHFQGAWFMPFVDKVDLVITGGLSIFNVSQEFARNVQFNETGTSTVDITGVEVVRLKETGAGINIGADMTYMLYKNIGAGVLLRYTYGSVGFDLGEGQSTDVTAGGFQIAAGGRVRF